MSAAGLQQREEPNSTFLGMEFDFTNRHGDTFPVRPSDKTRSVIAAQAHIVENNKLQQFGALRELFSRCIYAARILRLPLARYYAVFKFFRRHFSRDTQPRTYVAVWACILPLWQKWIEDILRGMKPFAPFLKVSFPIPPVPNK